MTDDEDKKLQETARRVAEERAASDRRAREEADRVRRDEETLTAIRNQQQNLY